MMFLRQGGALPFKASAFHLLPPTQSILRSVPNKQKCLDNPINCCYLEIQVLRNEEPGPQGGASRAKFFQLETQSENSIDRIQACLSLADISLIPAPAWRRPRSRSRAGQAKGRVFRCVLHKLR
jgi:hypothetical protein